MLRHRLSYGVATGTAALDQRNTLSQHTHSHRHTVHHEVSEGFAEGRQGGGGDPLQGSPFATPCTCDNVCLPFGAALCACIACVSACVRDIAKRRVTQFSSGALLAEHYLLCVQAVLW